MEFDDFEPWVERFSRFPLVQLVDLDAAIGERDAQGKNRALVRSLVRRLPCQVGGGIRTGGNRTGASGSRSQACRHRIVVDQRWKSRRCIRETLARQVGTDKLVFAVDSKGGKVAIRGWRQTTEISAVEMIRALEPWCSAFLYTNIDTEGLLLGMPVEIVSELRGATSSD